MLLSKEIDNLIYQATKSLDKIRLQTLRNIKSEFLKFEKSGKDKVLNEGKEADILISMMNKSKDSIEQFKQGGRHDLASLEEEQLKIIQEFAPKECSIEEINIVIEQAVQTFLKNQNNGYKLSMKDTKQIVELAKNKCPNITGKHVSEYIKKQL